MADIALAASARDWPDRLHRFLLDHGGGRVVDRVMSADGAVGGSFDILLIDDVCSFLTPRLVSQLKRSGAEVIGVYSPEESADAKRRLLECGISDVIETEAAPEEFLAKIGQTLSHRVAQPLDPEIGRAPLSIAVTGPAEGVGTTEVAVALARSLSSKVGTVLVDFDPIWPSISQRLDLPVHPNIRTAIDHSLHRPDKLGDAVHRVERLGVVGGLVDTGHGSPIDRHEALALLDALGSLSEVLVGDMGPIHDVPNGLLREFDTVLIVGSSTPVGVTRLMKSVESVSGSGRSQSVLVVINSPLGKFQRAEALHELRRAFPLIPVSSLPHDSRMSDAVWNGTLDYGRAFRRAVDEMSQLVVGALA
jgi:MinD-like ATPase involved in chromosome partitioning or flagellar assembly